MRIFLDANILFSASLPESRLRVLLNISKGHAILLTNHYAAEEARRNLLLKKPRTLETFEKLLAECELGYAVTAHITVPLAEKDIPILGGAIASRATHLLTGDKRDFRALLGTTIQGVKIVSPAMFGAEFVKRKWMKKHKQ